MSTTADTPERATVLLSEYREVCASHAKITDFRAKLLALLPIASGAGIGVLAFVGTNDLSTTRTSGLSTMDAALILGLGVFGAVVTFGLFLYEVRQVDVCEQLRNHAEWLEGELGIAAGQFGGRRDRLSLREMYLPSARCKRNKKLEDREKEGLKDQSQPDRTSGGCSDEREQPHVKRIAKAVSEFPSRPLAGARTAGYVVYHSVIIAWVVLVLVGALSLLT